MSRTYRKISHIQMPHICDKFATVGGRLKWLELDKKTGFAIARSDGGNWGRMGNSASYWCNLAHRKQRQVARDEIQKIYRANEIDDLYFNDTEAVLAYRKVNWMIY